MLTITATLDDRFHEAESLSDPTPMVFIVQDDASARQLLQPFLAHPETASPIFLEDLFRAIGARAAETHGGTSVARASIAGGGLAPWQEKRAKSLLSDHLDRSHLIVDVARECRLSAGHFTRAFRQSTGLSPHKWLNHHRVDVAKQLLTDRTLPLSEIALACGFADQSHFTRVFGRTAGTSPGLWRRFSRREAPSSTHADEGRKLAQ